MRTRASVLGVAAAAALVAVGLVAGSSGAQNRSGRFGMWRRERRRTGGRAGWGLPVVVALVVLACAIPAVAAPPTTLAGASYPLMKRFMAQYDKDGFARVTSLGALGTYRRTLNAVHIRVDPTAGDPSYDPVSQTIILIKDPRTIKPEEAYDLGNTIWHEVTHAIEDVHGDVGVWDNPDHGERNIEYMTHVVRSALKTLEVMERKAKAGASVEVLRQKWDTFLKAMAVAAKIAVPPDVKLLKAWFGFEVDTQAIMQLYLSGKVLPGEEGENLRKALAPPTYSWSGRWKVNLWPGEWVLTQSGGTVTGYFYSEGIPTDEFVMRSKLSQNGRRLSGTIDQKTAGRYDWGLTVIMGPDGRHFSGGQWIIGHENDPAYLQKLEGTRM